MNEIYQRRGIPESGGQKKLINFNFDIYDGQINLWRELRDKFT